MKKKFILLPFVGALIYIVSSGYSYGPGSGGAGDLTGAHTGSTGCSCHNASATTSTTVAIELDSAGIQVFQYIGGHSYTIKLTGTQTSSSFTLPRFGYQLSVVSTGTTTSRGTLSAPSGSHTATASGTTVVEHSSTLLATSGSGGSGTTYVVNIPWTAPTTGTGCVTIYAVVNAVNYNGSDDAGDKWNNSSLTISEPAPAITGTTSACVGATTTLTDAGTCGSWSSSTTSVATVGSTSGIVYGVSAGTTTITYAIGSGNIATTVVTVNAPPTAPFGTTGLCATTTTTLGNITPGGTWTSGSTGVATVGSSSGVVSGITAGTSVITYTAPPFGCSSTITVTVNPLPGAITGTTSVCIGNTTALTDAGGGTWASGNTSVATVGTGSGIVGGASAGTSLITYTLPTGCSKVTTVTVNATVSPITGTTVVCPGFTTTLSDASGGGTWSSSNTAVAIVGTGTGVVTGVAGGTATIIYTLPSGCAAITVMTVNPAPSAISGTVAVCEGGSTITLSDATAGGIWSSGSTPVATVGSGSGVVTGVTAGSTIITYTLTSTGCITTTVVIVNPLPAPISGSPAVCVGGNTSLTDAGGGTWISSSTSVATINLFTGFLSGVSAGTTTISYTLSTGCRVTSVETVNPLPSAISGPSNLCVGSTTVLTDAGGGTWSSSNSAVASIGSATGILAGVSGGPATITYTLPITGCITTTLAIVNSVPGSILGATSVCAGSSIVISDGTGGGTWSSSDATVATIGSSLGTVNGVAAGTTIITYRLTSTGCLTTRVETVNPLPTSILGTLGICLGTSTTLSDGTGGGSWSSSNATIASISSGTGVVTGNVVGTSVITYTLGTGCKIMTTMTVYPLPAGISGPSTVCTGATITLSDAGSGTWSSSNTAVATAGITTGIISGVSSGSATITYTLSTGCTAIKNITVNPAAAAITGTTTVCGGATTALTDAGGGTWSSSNTFVATAGSSTGIITGVAGGTAVITYSLPTGCIATQSVLVNPNAPISGLSSMCAGLTTSLSDVVGGGTWSSSNTAVATIGSSSGFLTSISAGATVITYTLSTGCTSVSTLTVVSTPSSVSGNTSVCLGTPSSLTDAGGGTWTSSNTSVATVGFSTGIVSGVTLGTARITYSLGTGCTVTTVVTVNAVPASISGTAIMCAGATTSLSDLTAGGTWSSVNTSVATVGTGVGLVTGVSAGTSAISYTLGTGCAAVKTVTVNPLPSAIAGNAGVCLGSTTSLTDAGGGTWASGSTSVATVGFTTGIVSGIALGNSFITYTLPTGCSATVVVTVNPLPSAISGTTTVCVGAITSLTDAGGGTWSSSNANASVGSATGAVTGVTAGTSVITYMLGTGCQRTATVLVNPLPVVFTVTGGGPYCAGGTGTHIGLSSSSTGVTYKLYNGSSVVGTLSGTGSAIDFGTFTATGTYTVSATNAATSCTADMAGGTTVSINPLPTIYAVTGGGPYCAGGSGVHVGLTNSDLGIRYQLRLGSTSVGSPADGSGGVIDFGLITAAGTYTVIATDTTTLCTSNMTGSATVTVNPLPALITGAASVCTGSTVTLSSATTGGTWSSSDLSVATVGTSSGVVTGVGTGTSAISYTLSTGCMTNTTITVNPLPATPAVAGGGSAVMCAGATITVTDATAGGTWSTGSSAIATAGTATGIITGVSGGTVTISYRIATGCASTISATVNPAPAGIAGAASVCTGTTITLSDAVAGGTWTSSNTTVATAGVTSGIISGVAAGSTTVTYTLPAGCFTTRSLTVNLSPNAGTIVGATHQCIGTPLTLSDAAAGGVWSSSNTAVASVGSGTGVVTGISTGIVTLSYSVTNICGTAVATAVDTVIGLPSADTILGADTLCVGATVNLSDAAAGGTWSSSNPSVATVNGAGLVTGVSAGNATISYSVNSPCGPASATLLLTVKSLAACNVGVKPVQDEQTWRIYPNPSDGHLTVEIPAVAGRTVITVEDVLGKKVMEKVADGGLNKIHIDLGNVSSGSYIMRITAGDKVYRQKVEVVR
jgi:trimeric autotransporter adhesin